MNQVSYRISHYREKRVSLKQAVSVLARNNVEVTEDEASVILDFLYQIATAYYNLKSVETIKTLNATSNRKKVH
ncbi:hypothetical protein FO440_09745 [Mucilaginibacter corticis]|uniref:PTS sugar transporter subunit IIBC n=1 Tax=Mucilaginibacter corticis TaxID=2597670 RepID=A0A556MXB0_9SPHI|nr:hypothetical protein FO440_09745 [Mucilaginibacter corticis]